MFLIIRRNIIFLSRKATLVLGGSVLTLSMLLRLSGSSYGELLEGVQIQPRLSFMDVPFLWLIVEIVPYSLIMIIFPVLFQSDTLLAGRVSSNRRIFLGNFLTVLLIFFSYHTLLFATLSLFTLLEVKLLLANLGLNTLMALLCYCSLFFLRTSYTFIGIISLFIYSVFTNIPVAILQYTMLVRLSDFSLTSFWIIGILFLLLLLISEYITKTYFRERRYL